MGLSDILEAEDLCRLRLVGPISNAIDDGLESNLRQRKFRRSGHERTGEHAQMGAAGIWNGCPGTRLHLYFEAISGPWERLFDDAADLILHHIDRTDPCLESIDLFTVQLVPVVAPHFLRFPIARSITPEQMRGYVQCVIRDTRRPAPRSYYLIEGAQSWTVNDQLMKRELILQGMGTCRDTLSNKICVMDAY
jgi:hypothetical protein